MNIREEIKSIERLGIGIADLSKRHSEKMKSLVERLEHGESSGDRVFDFCVACYNQLGFDAEVRAPYVQLADKLKGRNGQEILWTHSIETPSEEHGYHQGADITMDMKIGRLNSDEGLEFDLKTNSIIFSVEPYLESHHTFPDNCDRILLGGTGWKFGNGRMVVSSTELPHLAGPVLRRFPYSSFGPYGKSQILVGEEVRKFFESEAGVNKSETYQSAIDLLTSEKETPREV